MPVTRRANEPLAEAEEVEAGGGEDVAELDLRPPAIARAPEAAAADPASERARDPRAGGVGRAEGRGGLTSAGLLERLCLRPRAQAEGPPRRPNPRATARWATRARAAILARERDPDQVAARRIGALSPAAAGVPRRAGRPLALLVQVEVGAREAVLRAGLPLVIGPRRPAQCHAVLLPSGDDVGRVEVAGVDAMDGGA